MDDLKYLSEAFDMAKAGLAEGGIPIGAVLVCDGEVLGRGNNRRVQQDSVIHHAEMNCFENAGRYPASVYRKSTLFSTLSPCFMCAGAAVLFGVKRVVIGENRTINMSEQFLRDQNVEVRVVDDPACYQLMQDYIKEHPEIWDEDKGDH